MEEQMWANDMVRENPYFVEGMTPEEYDAERKYYLENYEKIRSGKLHYNNMEYKIRCNHQPK